MQTDQNKKVSKFHGYWNRFIWFSQNLYQGNENVFSKQKPTIIHYGKFNDLNNDASISKLFNEEAISFEALRKLITLEKHAPSNSTLEISSTYMNKKLIRKWWKGLD